VYRTLNTNKKSKVQALPVRGKKVLDIRNQDQSESNSDNLQLPEKQTTPRGPNRTHQAESSVISEYTNWKKHLVVGREKRNILQDSVKGVAHKKRSETRYICKFCTVPLHKGSCFEKYYSVMSC
jgi:hypothetical protein